MRAIAGLPGSAGVFPRKRPLALAVLLHGALLFTVLHGLSPSIPQSEPREVMISLISLRTDTRHAHPTAQAPVPQRAVPQAQHEQVSELQPPPVVRETPAASAVPAATPAAAAAPVSAQESHTVSSAPPAPAPVVHQPPVAAERGPVMISSPEYLQAPKPDYPIGAKRAGEQGKVVLRILIDEKGLPERVDIQQSAGFPRLDDAARSAALRAIFKPHLEDGRAVPAHVLVPINFALK